MAKTVYLLGVKDPEMDEIEKLLKKRKLLFQHATTGVQRVHPGNEYKADSVQVLMSGDTLVCIECRPRAIASGVEVVVVDHHNPGDPGFSKKPQHYWEASSIGQVYKLLGEKPDQKVRVLAAMDHCFVAACNGFCPGVTPKEVISLKVREIAAATKVGASVVNKRIAHFTKLLASASEVLLDRTPVNDLRSYYLGEGHSLDLLSAQVAAAKTGCAVLLCSRDRLGELQKITLTGKVDASLVKTFMQKWAPQEGLKNIYGSPERGYAGGYSVKLV